MTAVVIDTIPIHIMKPYTNSIDVSAPTTMTNVEDDDDDDDGNATAANVDLCDHCKRKRNDDSSSFINRAMATPDSIVEDSTPCRKKPRRISFNRGKQVRFEVSQHDTSNVHIVPRIVEEEKHLIWYTQEDFHYQRWHDFQKMRQIVQGEDTTYRSHLFQVLGSACGKLPMDDYRTQESSTFLAQSPIRGLERDTTHCFRDRKKQVVQNVLQSQAALKLWRQGNHHQPISTEDELYASKVLAAHYRKLAAPAARFARLLGAGDANSNFAKSKR